MLLLQVLHDLSSLTSVGLILWGSSGLGLSGLALCSFHGFVRLSCGSGRCHLLRNLFSDLCLDSRLFYDQLRILFDLSWRNKSGVRCFLNPEFLNVQLGLFGDFGARDAGVHVGETVLQLGFLLSVNETDPDADVQLDSLQVCLVKEDKVVSAHIYFRPLWLEAVLAQNSQIHI